MSLLSHLKHAFHNVEHTVKDVVHGVGHVATNGASANDIAHGRLCGALHDGVSVRAKTFQADTAVRAPLGHADAGVDLHLSTALDKMAAFAKQMATKKPDHNGDLAGTR